MSYNEKDLIKAHTTSSENSLDEGNIKPITSNHTIINEKDVVQLGIDQVLPLSDDQVTVLLTILGVGNPEDPTELPDEIEFIISKIDEMTIDEAVEELTHAVSYHFQDPNIQEDDYQDYIRYSEGKCNYNDLGDVYRMKALAVLIKWWSPYAEVRAVTDPYDDPTLPVETFRAYFLATICTIVFSGFNEFFRHRLIAISVSTSVIQMLLYPLGIAWVKVVPDWGFTMKGKRYSINTNSPWNIKEQMFATLLFGISTGTFYSSYNILTQILRYGQHLSFGYQFWMSFPIQFIGFGFAGIMRRFVVYSSKAIWPSTLSTLALNRALLKPDPKRSKGISTYNFFWLAMGGIFLWTWVPQVLFNFLSTTNWLNIALPNNPSVAIWTGQNSGLGLTPLPFLNSFDWNYLGFMAPLVTPFFSLTNQIVGVFLCTFVVAGVYYSNYKGSAYLPIMSNALFTNTGEPFKIANILTPDFKFDDKKYQEYSPPFYSAGNIVSYGTFICIYPLIIVFSFITQWTVLSEAFIEWGRSLWSITKPSTYKELFGESKSLLKYRDPHSRMMRKYKEVPDWWYFLVLLVSLLAGILMLEFYKTNTPIWGLFMALGFNFVFLIPITILQATTGFSIGLNLLIEMITGYALPGNPLALMFLKAFGYNIDGQSENYISNIKMAHYAKIPPVALFRGQLIMVFIQIFVNLGVLNWQRHNVKGFCTPHQTAKLTCPDIATYFNASVVWGVIGPKRVFNGLYPTLKWCWLIGALLGAFFGIWSKFFPRYYPKSFNPILVVGGYLNFGPPYNISYALPSYFVGAFFMFYLRRWHLAWWEKYNYVLFAALTAGLAFSSIIIFFAIQYKGFAINWWGNIAPTNNLDGSGAVTLKNISELASGFFGPPPGSYP